MTSKAVAMLLADMEITRSHSRPRVSNDNPFSEALFKTLKSTPVFERAFRPIGVALSSIATFVEDCNHTHHHSGIGR